jgi:hypothetical protein
VAGLEIGLDDAPHPADGFLGEVDADISVTRRGEPEEDETGSAADVQDASGP